MIVREIPLAERRLVLVGERRHIVFHIKEIVGVVIHVRLWRRRQPHDQRVEIAEDRTVLLENAAVRLVDHDEVEMPRCKEPCTILRPHLVNRVQDRRIGRKDGACRRTPVAVKETARREIRQMLRERLLCLTHQLRAVGEKEDIRHPALREQHIHERDHRARLARARRHDEESLASVHRVCRTDAVNRLLLIGAVGDGGVDLQRVKSPCLRASADDTREIVLRKDRVHLTRRIGEIIPEIRIIAVRVENERPLPRHLFETVGIEPRLLAPRLGADRRLLCLDDRERLVIPAIEHIVGEPLARAVRQSNHGHLAHTVHIERPTHRAEVDVDDRAARLLLRPRVRDIVVCGGVLRTQSRQLLLQCLHRARKSRTLGGARLQLRPQTVKLRSRYGLLCLACEQCLVKVALLVGCTVAIVDKEDELEQVLK